MPSPFLPGFASGTSAAVVSFLASMLVALGIVVARRRSWPSSFRRALALLLVLLLAGAAAALMPPDLAAASGRHLRVVWVVVAWMAAIEVVQGIVFDLALVRLLRRPPLPRILRDFLTLMIAAVVLVLALRGALGVNLSSILATSAMLSLVLGLALQDTLGSFFAGLALQMEQPLAIGDWVQAGEFAGQVTQVSWRAVHLRTLDEDEVAIPNALLARSTLTNYSRPTPVHLQFVDVRVHFRHPPSEVIAALEEAMRGVEGVLESPACHALLWSYAETSIVYRARFYLDDFARLNRLRAAVGSRIWYRLRRAGFEIPHPGMVLHRAAPEPADAAPAAEILAGVDVFGPLTPAERALLASRLRQVTFGSGETIIRQGQEGDSLFVLVRGEVEVRVASGAGEGVVGRLAPGSVFGEMSLLTGEPRTATVVATRDAEVLPVGREDFRRVAAANPALLEAVARVVGGRRGHLRETLRETEEAAASRAASHRDLLGRIRSFFDV